MKTCSICKKEREMTYPVSIYYARQNLGVTTGYSGGQRVTQTRYADFGSFVAEVCPCCIMRKLKNWLIKAAVVVTLIAGAVIYGESRGVGDTLSMLGIYIAVLLILLGIYFWGIADVKKERRFQLGQIQKRGWPLTAGYQGMAEAEMVHSAAKTNHITEAVAYFSEAAYKNMKPY